MDDLFLKSLDSTDLSKEDADRASTLANEIPAEEDELSRLERSRLYRRRYKERQKEKDKQLIQQVQETELEVERLRLEQAALISQSHALASLCTYSNNMVEALSAAASASAAKAISLGGQAIEGVNTFRGWARHQWIMLPTAAELMMGSVWLPTDDHMRFVMKVSKPEDFVTNHAKFIERLAELLEEGKRSEEAKHHVELKIDYLLSIWVRFTLLCCTERREMMEEIVCSYQLKSLRDQAASGQYVRPQILQFTPTELAGCVDLSLKQKAALEEHWQQFVSDIKAARAFLGEHTTQAADGMVAAMETGQYNPSSSKAAAECFLLTTNAADASDEFLAREGRAFMNLWIGAIQVLTPVQTAVVLTSCRPLVAHLPDVCNMLLHGNGNGGGGGGDDTHTSQTVIEGQGFSIIEECDDDVK